MDKNGKKCCISFGKCNKKYFLIILGIIGLIISIIVIFYIFEYTKISSENDKVKKEKENVLNFISYLFFINLGESLMIIPSLILKKNMSSKKSADMSRKSSEDSIERYIFNKKSINFAKKEKIYFFLFGLLKLFVDIIQCLYSYIIENYFILFSDSSRFELLFLYIISKYIYHFNSYKHQYISIIILTVLGILEFIIHYYDDTIYNIIAIFLIDILYSFLKSLFTVYIKGLMEFKYISPYKACFMFGIYNFFIIIIAFIIATFCPCGNSSICKVVYNDKRYFAHILAIFNITGLLLFVMLLLKAIITILNYITINYFSVFHSFLLIYFIKIFNIIGLRNKDSENYFKLYMYIFSFIIGLFFVLLFLEIIELNIFKISYNSKKNIEERAILDENGDDNDNSEEEENEEANTSKEELLKIN